MRGPWVSNKRDTYTITVKVESLRRHSIQARFSGSFSSEFIKQWQEVSVYILQIMIFGFYLAYFV